VAVVGAGVIRFERHSAGFLGGFLVDASGQSFTSQRAKIGYKHLHSIFIGDPAYMDAFGYSSSARLLVVLLWRGRLFGDSEHFRPLYRKWGGGMLCDGVSATAVGRSAGTRGNPGLRGQTRGDDNLSYRWPAC